MSCFICHKALTGVALTLLLIREVLTCDIKTDHKREFYASAALYIRAKVHKETKSKIVFFNVSV